MKIRRASPPAVPEVSPVSTAAPKLPKRPLPAPIARRHERWDTRADACTGLAPMSPKAIDELKSRWRLQLGAAKVAWSELTDAELREVEGREEKLAGLIETRYALTRDEAVAQARHFFAANRP